MSDQLEIREELLPSFQLNELVIDRLGWSLKFYNQGKRLSYDNPLTRRVQLREDLALLGYDYVANRFGGKVAGLTDLYTWGNVPLFFALPPEKEFQPDAVVLQLLASLAADGTSDVTARDSKWAVRSSGLHEDSTKAALAGQFATFLNVPLMHVPNAIAQVRESQALGDEYLQAMGYGSSDTPTMGVIVQKMVQPEFAGVTFIGDPSTGDPDVIITECVKGLGDKLVGGEVNPDHRTQWHVDDLIAGRSGNSELSQTVLKPLWRMLQHNLRKTKAMPHVDLEWAISDSMLWWLQKRALTNVEWAASYIRGQSILTSAAELQAPVTRLDDDRVVTGVSRFPKNDILVTRMTNPRMINAMLKASGFVTEVGGTTCHAAIVARELNKPCVVGCSQARFIQTGDVIKMLPKEGRIELIESKK